MASQVDSWTETCSCCGYSAKFYKYSCGCITRYNTDKWKKPCSECDTFTEEYDCGQYGDRGDHEGPGERRERLERERREADSRSRYESDQQESYSSVTGTSDNVLFQLLGKLLGILLIGFIIVWLISNVVIPLLVMDIAIICLGVGYFNEKLRKILLPTSILGAILFIFDYNLGWTSQRFASHVSFLAGLVPILFVLNICAGLASCYLLISTYLKTSKPEFLTQPKKKNLVIGGLVLSGIIILGFQFIKPTYGTSTVYKSTKTQPMPAQVVPGEVPQPSKAETSTVQEASNDFQPFYILNVAAYKTEEQAQKRVADLTQGGKSAGYLWIPDYPSLSGAQLYCVYIGPFETQNECEIATEEYRKKYPGAYGLLVSKEARRVQINGIGKVVIKDSTPSSSICGDAAGSGNEIARITGDNVRVRSEPDSGNDDNIVQRVNKGNLARILDKTTNQAGETWFKICYDGQIGWVIGNYVEVQ